jgi:arsenate reductase
MNTKLKQTIDNLNTDSISEERKKVLQPILSYIQSKDNSNPINLNFICTHNSRRSHLGQIWMQTLSAYYNFTHIYSYSGGTEATALALPVIQTLKDQGFQIEKISDTNNPIYSIKTGQNTLPIIAFSKKFEHSYNPASDFIAIMTCSQADEGCPFVPGSEKRFALTYDDPKAFDGTPQQNEKYLERSIEIATELKYIISQI